MSDIVGGPATTQHARADQPARQQLRERATRGVAWAAIRTWSVQAGSLLIFVVLARIIGPRAFGLVALATVYLELGDRMIDQGFSDAIIQRQDLDDEHLDSAFWISMAIAVAIALLTLVTAPFVASVTHQPDLVPVLRVLSLTFIFTALVSVQDGILRRRMAFRSLAMRGIASVVVGGMAGIVMALLGFGVWSLVGQQLAWELTAIAVLWRATGWRPGFRVSRQRITELWHYGAPITGTRLLYTAQRRASDFIVGAELGSTALGHFAVGQRMVTSLSTMLVDSIGQVAFPALARIQHDVEHLKRAYYKATQFSAAVTLPAFVGLAALAPDIIASFFGPRWLPSVRVSQVLAMVGLLSTINTFNGIVLQSIGAVRVQFWLRMCGTLMTIGAIIFALPWGINGVATAMLASMTVFVPCTWLAVWYFVRIDFREIGRRIGPSVAGALAALLLVAVARSGLAGQQPIVILTVSGTLGAAVYLGGLRLLSPGLVAEGVDMARRWRAERRERRARRDLQPQAGA